MNDTWRMHVDDSTFAALSRALANPARVRILRLLAEQTECRGADVFSELPLAQSTVSEHLRVLREAGLLNAHPVGTSMVYCLVPEVLREYRDAVGELAAAQPCSPGEGIEPGAHDRIKETTR